MSNNILPKITIVTPVKNSVNTLENAIKSLVAQNYPNLEYIVLDGGSNDGTVEIIKKYEKYINYWKSKKDKGPVDGYIDGIKKASHDIIAFLNADDFYEPEILLKAGKEFADNPDLDMVSFRYRVVKYDSSILEEVSLEDIKLRRDKMPKTLGINARFFKKDLFYRYGFPVELDDQGRTFIGNDLEYMIRFLLKGIKGKDVDCVGYNYLYHSGSLTFNNDPLRRQRLVEDKIFIAKKFLAEQNELPLGKFWQKSFKKWIKKYRAKLVKSNLELKNYQAAKKHFYIGLKENNNILFLFYLIKTLFRK